MEKWQLINHVCVIDAGRPVWCKKIITFLYISFLDLKLEIYPLFTLFAFCLNLQLENYHFILNPKLNILYYLIKCH